MISEELARVYDDRVSAFKTTVAEYVRSWIAVLRAGDPRLALAHTVEIQSQSGELVGLIVLPSHPLRVAWHAAYDNVVLHTRFDEKLKPADIRREMAALDGATFPAFLPGFTLGRSFVFADTLGFHAVGMVTDSDAEPKATLAILHRALVTREAEASGGVPTVGLRSADLLGDEIRKYLEAHEAVRVVHVHALRAGDGKTVVRALGRAARKIAESRRSDRLENGESSVDRLVYVLELHPSATQLKRGVAGRFIAEAQEKRRRGAGILEEVDRWDAPVSEPTRGSSPSAVEVGAQRRPSARSGRAHRVGVRHLCVKGGRDRCDPREEAGLRVRFDGIPGTELFE